MVRLAILALVNAFKFDAYFKVEIWEVVLLCYCTPNQLLGVQKLLISRLLTLSTTY